MAFSPALVPSNQKIALTLDSSQITADQTDFPLTVVLDGADPLHEALFTDLGSNSKKLSIQSGDTQLPVEIEYWGTRLSEFVYADVNPILHFSMENFSVNAVIDDINEEISLNASNWSPIVGKFNTGLSQPDTSYPLSLPSDTSFKSISLWIKRTNLANYSAFCCNASGVRLIATKTSGTGNYIYFYNGTVGPNTTLAVSDTNWHHVVIVEGSNSNYHWVYLDGVKDAGEKLSNLAGVVKYFSRPSYASGQENCNIDNLQIYDYKLTDSEVVDLYNSAIPTAVLHTKVPTYSASANTELILSYDSTQVDNTDYVGETGSAPAKSVWDSNFLGVWHMAQDPSGGAGCILDSTGNANHGTPTGLVAGDLMDGLVNKSLNFALGKYINCGNAASLNNIQTYECGFYNISGTNGGYGGLISKYLDNANRIGLYVSPDKNDPVAYLGTNIYLTAPSVSYSNVTDWHFVTFTNSGIVQQCYIDGIASGVAGAVVCNPSATNNGTVYLGAYRYSTGLYPMAGRLSEVRLSSSQRSPDWIKLTNLSLTNQLITFSAYSSPTGVLIAFSRQLYDLNVDPFRIFLEQLYHLPTPIQIEQEQVYGLRLAQLLTQRFADAPTIRALLHEWYGAMPELRKTLWQMYGSPLELRAKLAQSITDAPLLRSGLVELYEISLGLITTLEQSSGATKNIRLSNTQNLGECLTLRARLEQSYRDALKLLAVSEQSYTVAFPLLALVQQLYAVSGVALQTAVIQPSNLTESDFIKSQLQQIYMSSSAGSQSLHSFSLTVGGRNIYSFVAVGIEAGREQYCLTGDISLKSQAEYLPCIVGEPVVITHNAETYHFIVESLARSRSPGQASYTVNIASPAILLDAPHALPMTQEFAPNMAATIAQELVAGTGITLVWQILDWPISKNTLYATDETPLDVLRRIVAAVGGILQSRPDGSLVACYRYPVDIDKLATGIIDHYYTDADNMFSVADSLDLRSGQNVYLISDGLLSEKTHNLREIAIDDDPYGRIIQGYIVPWTGDGVELTTSGGNWVSIEPMGIITEQITEQLEFVNGESSTSSPIYAMLDRTWRERSLGAITYGESGTLSSEIDGESLAEITYQTKYHQWLVRDNAIEDVQFILTAA